MQTLDEPLQRARALWRRSDDASNECLSEAISFCDQYRFTKHHAAYAWGALTCGKLKLFDQELLCAEAYLADAFGRFEYLNDEAGAALASALLGAAASIAGNNRDMELATRPLKKIGSYADADQALIHTLVGSCYWRREQPHEALTHLLKEHDIAVKLKSPNAVARVLANVALILEHLGEFELAVDCCEKAIDIHRNQSEKQQTLPSVTMLITMCHLSHVSNDTQRQKQYAPLLASQIAKSRVPAHWVGWAHVSRVYSDERKLKEAARCLAVARELCPSQESPRSRATMAIAESEFLAASGELAKAKQNIKWVCDAAVTDVGRSNCYLACKAMSKYASMGQSAVETRKWDRQAEALRSPGFLGNILSDRIRARIHGFNILEALTEKELACLSLSARGQTSADIGLKLGITPRTVNFHFSKILRKLEAMNRQEAIAKAMSANLIERPFA